MLSAGTRAGPYEIVSPLGAGGMGEVYRARDTRLGRDVALKVLPEDFARESDRLHRFEQEARAIAALNHPNILAVFDIGQLNGSPYLISELLEGESLRSILDHGALPQRKAVEYGVQIAQGLAAAHEKGIVHRDVKPENIVITKDERVKILDFGLAKLAGAGGTEIGPDSITRTSSHTAPGVVMGTASYMAPEQVRGQAADARTDIFAFGAVLYEVLSGQRAFRHDTPAETMTAILKDDPLEFSNVTHSVSPALDRIIRRCLEKNPEQRFQSARDLSFALGTLSGTDASSTARVSPAPGKIPAFAWAGFALAIIAAIAVTLFLARRPASVTRMQFPIPIPGEVSHMELSSDGSMLAFVSPDATSGVPMLYVQRIGSPEAKLLGGTDGATYPFWSPDGANIAFFANGKLLRVPVSGGTPQRIADVLAARGGSWGSGNVIIFSPYSTGSLWRVNPDGSGLAQVTKYTEPKGIQSHRWPMFLPDGNRFLFWNGNFRNAKDDRSSGIYLGSLDGKEQKLLLLCRSSFGYDRSHLFYANDAHQLISVSFDPSTGAVSGTGTPFANLVGFQPATYWAAVTTAQNGTVVYSTSTGATLSVLTWIDRSGRTLGKIGERAVMCNPTLSPDNSRVAIDISDVKTNNVDVWLENSSGPSMARFTFNPEEEVVGVWSRDGHTIAYRTSGVGLYLKPASGLEREKQLYELPSTGDLVPNSWSPDDKKILFTHMSPSGLRLELISVTGGDPAPFLQSKSNQTNGMISPDGKWVAYSADESGNWEIYVTNYPSAAGKWQVSRGGGSEPRWRGDSKELFYIGPKDTLMSVPVTATGDSFSSGTPAPLFQVGGRAAISSTDIFTYDVAKDGNRFLVNRYVQPDHIEPLTVVFNASVND
jgi:eukaryotic-like serine/threonine-protein kinase